MAFVAGVVGVQRAAGNGLDLLQCLRVYKFAGSRRVQGVVVLRVDLWYGQRVRQIEGISGLLNVVSLYNSRKENGITVTGSDITGCGCAVVAVGSL